MAPSDPQDPFHRVEVATQALARRVLWEQGNRIGLLRVHAFVGVVAGVQMLTFGGPYQLEALFGPSIRMFLGTLGLIGGLTLFSGLRATPRSIYREAGGLALLALWDLTMTCGLAYARYHTTSFGLQWPWEPIPPAAEGYVAPYPIAVYGGMFMLLCIHLSTLRRFLQNGAPPAGKDALDTEEGDR